MTEHWEDSLFYNVAAYSDEEVEVGATVEAEVGAAVPTAHADMPVADEEQARVHAGFYCCR